MSPLYHTQEQIEKFDEQLAKLEPKIDALCEEIYKQNQIAVDFQEVERTNSVEIASLVKPLKTKAMVNQHMAQKELRELMSQKENLLNSKTEEIHPIKESQN